MASNPRRQTCFSFFMPPKFSNKPFEFLLYKTNRYYIFQISKKIRRIFSFALLINSLTRPLYYEVHGDEPRNHDTISRYLSLPENHKLLILFKTSMLDNNAVLPRKVIISSLYFKKANIANGSLVLLSTAGGSSVISTADGSSAFFLSTSHPSLISSKFPYFLFIPSPYPLYSLCD